MIEVGASGKYSAVVTEALTARSMKSGSLPVYATPAMVAAMEAAAVDAVSRYIEPDCTTVGCGINISHQAPTFLGEEVCAEATVTKIEGRMLRFEVKAYDKKGIIGEGEHTRVVVLSDKFINKAKDRSV